MTPALERMLWLVNTLLDDRFVEKKAEDLALTPIPYDLPNWLQANFDAEALARSNEAQLEDELIAPLLKQLGWTRVSKQPITVQGKLAIPDWCLLADAAKKDAFQARPDCADISAICVRERRWDLKRRWKNTPNCWQHTRVDFQMTRLVPSARTLRARD